MIHMSAAAIFDLKLVEDIGFEPTTPSLQS